MINNYLGFAFVFLVFLGPFECSADICEQRGPCKCVYPNGTGVDLSPSVLPNGFYPVSYYKPTYNAAEVAKYELQTYYFHPCADVSLNVSVNSCNRPMTVSTFSYSKSHGICAFNIVCIIK